MRATFSIGASLLALQRTSRFFVGAKLLAAKNGHELVKFFFLLNFAAAIPAPSSLTSRAASSSVDPQ
jgi:hypothetical protein